MENIETIINNLDKYHYYRTDRDGNKIYKVDLNGTVQYILVTNDAIEGLSLAYIPSEIEPLL